MFTHDETEVLHFWHFWHRCDALSFSVHCIKGYMVSICLIASDVNRGHLEKVIFARYLPYKVIVSLLIINKCLMGRYIETIQISCFCANFYPPVLASVSGSCLRQYLLRYLPNGDFLFPSFPLPLLVGILLGGRAGPSSAFIYLVS